MIELNKIDKTRSEGMLAAAKKVGKQHAHDFSPKLKKLKRLAHLWRQLLSMIKTSIDPSKTIAQINQVDNTADLRVCPSERDCNRKLRKAQKYLKEAIPKHTHLCREFLSERRSELSEDPKDAKKRRIIERIQRQEAKKQIHERIGFALKPRNQGGLSHILIPKGLQPTDYPYDPETVTEWESIHDPALIEEFLLARNKTHFGQAHGTPFTTKPLDAIGAAADTAISEAILQGNIPNTLTSVDPSALDILNKIADRIPAPFTPSFTTDDIRKGFRKWRESTSTSPSGLHLGLWKAMTHPPATEQDENMMDRIWELNTKLLQIPFTIGEPLDRWKTIVNAMIEKIPGQPYLHKM